VSTLPKDVNKRSKILIVDDNDGDILLLREAFRAAGLEYDVVAFTDGEEALRHLEAAAGPGSGQVFDLVFLDMHLPKMEGTVILAAIRASRTQSRTPVIVLSSAISQADRELMRGYKVARHLVKPVDLDAFLQIGKTAREVLLEYQDHGAEEGKA
jgi:CheY-like chemotaxis protein